MKYLSLVLFLISALWSTQSFSRGSQFEKIAGDFRIDNDEWEDLKFNGSTCDTCHRRQENDPNLRLTSDTVAADAEQVEVTVLGLRDGNFSFSWNYATPVDRQKEGNVNAEVEIGNDSSPEIDYCIINRETNTNKMYYNCDTLEVERRDPVNTAPQINTIGNQTLTEDDTKNITVSAADEDPDSVTFSISSNSNENVVRIADQGGGTFQLTAENEGEADITVLATDNKGATDTETFRVTVNRSGGGPIIPPIEPIVIEVDVSFSFIIGVDNIETSGLSLALSENSNPEVVSVSLGSGLGVTVGGLKEGNASIALEVKDPGGNTIGTVRFMVTVNEREIAPAPIAVNDQFVFTFDTAEQLLYVRDNDSDPEGSALTIRLDVASTALGGSVDIVNAVQAVVYTPPADFTQDDSFSYQVMNASGQISNAATVIIKPSDLDGDGSFDNVDNCLILANPDQLDLDNDDIGNLCDSDPDGDGVIGQQGMPFTSGKALVERICLDCHRVGLVGSPAFGDEPAWAARVRDAGGIQPLLDSVTLGKGEMPAWGREYTARDLTQSVLYITGLEDGFEPGIDRDLDGIDDLNDNCVNHPNSSQSDEDNDGIGDDCEPDRNGDGILDYSLSFTMYQETTTGRVTGGIARADSGEVTLIARTRAAFDGLTFDWSGNSDDVLDLLGSVTTGEVVRFTPTASDVGIYDLLVKVQGPDFTGSTRARLVITDASGISLSDTDYDGYPASLDDDNGNANRVLTNPLTPNSASIFYSDQSITLGRLTAYIASRKGYSSVSAALTESEFLEAARAVEPSVTPVADTIIGRSIGVMNFELRDLDTTSANVRLNLLGNIPLDAEFKIYNLASATWKEFVSSADNSLFSAPSESSECPASNSSNYSVGMTAGHACVRFRLTDGGPNDADGVRDGVISIIGAIGTTPLIEDPGTPSPGKSGGGSSGWLVLIALIGRLALRRNVKAWFS